MKTDVEGIEQVSKGVLVNVASSGYELARSKKLEEIRLNQRVDAIESKMSNIEQMLIQLLERK